MSTILKPFDTADSPGPIPSVTEQFQHNSEESRCTRCFPEPTDFTIILVTPEHAADLGHNREDVGLFMYHGLDCDGEVSDLHQAAVRIKQELGDPVRLVEHHADLTYWTAEYADAD